MNAYAQEFMRLEASEKERLLQTHLPADATMRDIQEHCTVEHHSDGREVVVYKGQPIIEFLPLEITSTRWFRSFKIKATQKYRVLV